MPRRSSVSGSSSMFRPSILISPESNGISRLTILSAVVLPPPDGPTRTQNAARRDLERQVVDRGRVPARVPLRHVVEDDLSCLLAFRIPAKPMSAAGADEPDRDPHGEPEP